MMQDVWTVRKLPGEVFFRRAMQSDRCRISIGTKGGIRNEMILAAVSWMAAMLSAVMSIEACSFWAVCLYREMVFRYKPVECFVVVSEGEREGVKCIVGRVSVEAGEERGGFV